MVSLQLTIRCQIPSESMVKPIKNASRIQLFYVVSLISSVQVSDPYHVYVCNNCGLIVVANLRTNSFECKVRYEGWCGVAGGAIGGRRLSKAQFLWDVTGSNENVEMQVLDPPL